MTPAIQDTIIISAIVVCAAMALLTRVPRRPGSWIARIDRGWTRVVRVAFWCMVPIWPGIYAQELGGWWPLTVAVAAIFIPSFVLALGPALRRAERQRLARR